MRKYFLLIIIAFSSCISFASDKINPQYWQADLRYLQQTVHKEYSFLFKKVTAKVFDAEVEKLYQAIPSLQDHQILAGFGRIVSLFKYGHTDIGWSAGPVKYHLAPLNLYWFSDGLYIEGADKKYADLAGSRVIKVEGISVEEAMMKIKPLVPAENDMYFKAYGPDFLIIPEALHAQGITPVLKSTITYTLEKDGNVFEKQIPVVDAYRLPRKYGFVAGNRDWLSVRDSSSTPLYLRNLDKIYYYEYLPAQKTVYVRHSQILDEPGEPIPVFYKKVFEFIEKNDVEKLILDVRLNGGGNNYKNKPIVTGIIETKKINQPGKLFVITGRRTFSACQNLVNELSNYTNAIFVGEPTSENINFYGDNRKVELPNTKLNVYLSFAWWQDKPQWENADWMAPQVAVDMRFDDYRMNRDPLMETILDMNEKDVVLDPMAPVRELFQAGKLNELESLAKKMVKEPRFRYINFEEKFNTAGYQLLNAKRTEQAVFVFELNTRLYPASANCWDSLGEALWKAGQKDKAIQSYKKANELDLNGETGRNAMEMIKKINQSGGH